ncbi:hypothetical protein [Methylomonas rapida]|uniref:YhhN-like protein n=1 Tax=Methylomonas rapida TaxID=2963939 RepID=A0ABY7GFR1_9GAMM|nr:hypothetical protein [Methylomonas rapida]WAR44107.1 hypothetical protein NM686_017280 [Methylomonas rapida]
MSRQLYLLFITLTVFAGGDLERVRPVFLNLCMIGAAIWFSPLFAQPSYRAGQGLSLALLIGHAAYMVCLELAGIRLRHLLEH